MGYSSDIQVLCRKDSYAALVELGGQDGFIGEASVYKVEGTDDVLLKWDDVSWDPEGKESQRGFERDLMEVSADRRDHIQFCRVGQGAEDVQCEEYGFTWEARDAYIYPVTSVGVFDPLGDAVKAVPVRGEDLVCEASPEARRPRAGR